MRPTLAIVVHLQSVTNSGRLNRRRHCAAVVVSVTGGVEVKNKPAATVLQICTHISYIVSVVAGYIQHTRTRHGLSQLASLVCLLTPFSFALSSAHSPARNCWPLHSPSWRDLPGGSSTYSMHDRPIKSHAGSLQGASASASCCQCMYVLEISCTHIYPYALLSITS